MRQTMRTAIKTAVWTPSLVILIIHHCHRTSPSTKSIFSTAVKMMMGTTGFRLLRIITRGIWLMR